MIEADNLPRLFALTAAFVLTTFGDPAAQAQLTIPEAVGRGLTERTVIAGSGEPPTAFQVAADADLIVTGTVRAASSYLSTDQREIYTDYELSDIDIVYERVGDAAARPSTSITITLRGGVVKIGDQSFVQRELALPPLEVGSKGLFFLKRAMDKNHIALRYYGAFQMKDGLVFPLVTRDSFAPEYRSRPAQEVIDEIRSLLVSQPQ